MNHIAEQGADNGPKGGGQINLGAKRERDALWEHLDSVCLEKGGMLWQASESIKQAQQALLSGEDVNLEELASMLALVGSKISTVEIHMERVVEILGEVATADNEPEIYRGQILNTAQAAKLLRCSVTTIEERLRTGELPGEKYGDGWILPGQALIERVNEVAQTRSAERRLVRSTPPALAKVIKPRYNKRLKQLIGEV